MLNKILSGLVVLIFLTVSAQAQVRPTESGGVLMPEQAAFDVRHYDLDLNIDPDKQSIQGSLTLQAKVLMMLDTIVLDLDTPFTVDGVEQTGFIGDDRGEPLKFRRTGKQIWISLPNAKLAGATVYIRVKYSGKPRVAPNPPWVGGFVWSKTESGEHWFATAVQMDGADLWFPVKDHPSDKPETTSLHFTVPKPLVAASNGRLELVVDHDDGTQTFHWFVSQPISNYGIALNVAPYKLVEDEMKSIAGDKIPIAFYVLPEHADKAQSLIDKTKDYVRFFEEYLGPYPFRADKLGIAETPHLGMEHQSIIAYGNGFKYDQNGFDWLMFHELGHEWWANLVTAPDWNDFWIHEGFQSFMDALWAEKHYGRAKFIETLPLKIKSTKNLKPLAPREPRSTTEMYYIAPEYVRSDGDIYGKGALVLNSLRGLLGDDVFFKALRTMSYPDPATEKINSGGQNRFATTEDFMKIAERISGKDLGWFFEVYVRQADLPKLVVETSDGALKLSWETQNNRPFPMPVEIMIGDQIKVVAMKDRSAFVEIPKGTDFVIDPNGWLLRAP